MTFQDVDDHEVVFREGAKGAYGIINHLISPRAIAWVVSRSVDGVDNLAPHSYVTVASTDPLVVAFTSMGHKDTLRNIQATKEFVVCGVSQELRDKANRTGAAYPPEVSEIDEVGLTREPSFTVSTPRVRESPFAIECRFREVLRVGNATMILGDVTCMAVRREYLTGTRVSGSSMNLVGRGGGDDWFGLGERWSIPRVVLGEGSSA